MKALKVTFLVSIMMVAIQAGATTRSDMEVIKSYGSYHGLKTVELTVIQGQEAPTAIELNYKSVIPEEFQVPSTSGEFQIMPLSQAVDHLTIVGSYVNGCGSTIYEAEYTEPGYARSRKEVVLVDHRTRVCEDLVRHLWEARVVDQSGIIESEMELIGNPQAL